MSNFRKKLSELMSSAYANEENEGRDLPYNHRTTTVSDRGNDMSFMFKNRQNQSQSIPKRYSKQYGSSNANNISINSLSYFDHNSKQSTSQTFLKKRGITSDILNNSAISPLYTEKDSFCRLQTENSINSRMFRYRLDSRNKQQSRIKKEIDYLSNSFKESAIPQGNLNRPVVLLNKPEYANFSINYASSIALIKDKNKNNKGKGLEGKYVSYPNANFGLFNNRKGFEEKKLNGGRMVNNHDQKQKITMKNDLDDLYDLLNRQKKKH